MGGNHREYKNLDESSTNDLIDPNFEELRIFKPSMSKGHVYVI